MTFKGQQQSVALCSHFHMESAVLARRPSSDNQQAEAAPAVQPQQPHNRQPLQRRAPSNLNRNLLALVLGLSIVASFSAQIPAVAGLACYETVNVSELFIGFWQKFIFYGLKRV